MSLLSGMKGLLQRVWSMSQQTSKHTSPAWANDCVWAIKLDIHIQQHPSTHVSIFYTHPRATANKTVTQYAHFHATQTGKSPTKLTCSTERWHMQTYSQVLSVFTFPRLVRCHLSVWTEIAGIVVWLSNWLMYFKCVFYNMVVPHFMLTLRASVCARLVTSCQCRTVVFALFKLFCKCIVRRQYCITCLIEFSLLLCAWACMCSIGAIDLSLLGCICAEMATPQASFSIYSQLPTAMNVRRNGSG